MFTALAKLARFAERPLCCTCRCTEHAGGICPCPGTCKQVAGSLDISSRHRQWGEPAGLVPAQVDARSSCPTAGTCPCDVHPSGTAFRTMHHTLHGLEVIACGACCAITLPNGVD